MPEKISSSKITSVFNHNLHLLFVFLMVVTTLLSFYFFINITVLNEYKHRSIFTSWQFPMLLAILVDVFYES